jgi:hypothetical protein
MKTDVAKATNKIKSKGGRPPKGLIRNELLAVRLLPNEKKSIVAKAKTARLTPSEWFRKAALKASVVQRLSAEENKYLRMLSGMANNLNQLTKLAHGKGLPAVITVLIGVLEKVNELMDKIIKDDQ